jgi:hypothetical protein
VTEGNSPNNLTPDQSAAHDFLTELRTRIAVQPLPYQAGVEARALESLWEIFGHARNAMKKYPGCVVFAREVTEMLNMHLRPVTTKWHRAHAEGRLDSRDGADEFRGDLATVRSSLWKCAEKLHHMAYGAVLQDKQSPPVMSEQELQKCFQDVAFGIAPDRFIPAQKVAEMNRLEADEVAKRRTHHRIETTAGLNAVGVGLSGGGIRSATFCLGALQVMAERGLLKDVDFLSTVSGGGYVGSFLSSRLGNSEPHTVVAGPNGPDPEAIRYLRQNAKYLSASDLKQRWSMVVAVLAGMLLNWTAPLLVIAGAALIAQFVPKPPWSTLTAWSAIGTAIALMLYGIVMRSGERATTQSSWLLAALAVLTVALGICWLIDSARDLVMRTTLPNWKSLTIGGSLAAVAPAILRFVPVLRTPGVRRIVLQILLVVAGIIIPVAAITLFYALLSLGVVPLIVIVALAAVSAFFLNVNLTGPHRLYRDQLAKTFVYRNENDNAPKPLETLNPAESAPYHLINATANLGSSTSPTLRDRKGDFFLFSKHWCGAPATGYLPTAQWRTNGLPPDLATAMAISGAAFSSHMGLASMPTLTALLTFVNVRLGFWIRNPNNAGVSGTPGFLRLLQEMTGIAMSEKQPWLNLSDGGHIENMAVYELLRRRCKFIVSIDGEADPQCSFHGHLTLVRHAQIDLGIRIDSTLEDLRPNPASKYSKTHYMFCRIHYPAADSQPAAVGLLLYVKLSTTGNEEELIKRYRLTHPEFPHQSTLDQFFDEEQFEAYRQLGVHVMDGLFSKALMNNTRPSTIPEWFHELARNLLEPAHA